MPLPKQPIQEAEPLRHIRPGDPVNEATFFPTVNSKSGPVIPGVRQAYQDFLQDSGLQGVNPPEGYSLSDAARRAILYYYAKGQLKTQEQLNQMVKQGAYQEKTTKDHLRTAAPMAISFFAPFVPAATKPFMAPVVAPALKNTLQQENPMATSNDYSIQGDTFTDDFSFPANDYSLATDPFLNDNLAPSTDSELAAGTIDDGFLDAAGGLLNKIPQPVRDIFNKMFGGMFQGGLGGLIDSYRGYEASKAMQDAVNAAKENQIRYYGDAQNYLLGGRDLANTAITDWSNLGRQDLAYGRDTGRQDFTDAETRGANAMNTAVAQSREDIRPWYEGGQAALSQQMGLLGLGPTNGMTPSQILEQTPGYQWTLDQGLKAVQNGMGARGLGISGARDKARMGYASGLASQTFNDRLTQLGQLSNLGYGAGTQMSNNQMTLGNILNNNAMNTGAGLANLAYGTGNKLADNSLQTGAIQSGNYADTGKYQASAAMDQGQNMGYMDMIGGAEKVKALTGNRGSGIADLVLLERLLKGN